MVDTFNNFRILVIWNFTWHVTKHWLFKMHPTFEKSNGNLNRCIRSAFHEV